MQDRQHPPLPFPPLTFCSSRISSARLLFSQSSRCSSAACTEHFSMLSSSDDRSSSKPSGWRKPQPVGWRLPLACGGKRST